MHGDKPVYLRDVATIVDGPEEPSQYVFFGDGRGAHSADRRATKQPAVTLTIAKRPGAPTPSRSRSEVLKKVETLKGRVIPNGVQVSITRHYGQTAEEKSDELLLHMGIAVIGVSVLILLTLGWRESLIVGIAIPCTLALTLLVFYLHGYTLNRITLFALIFSIGILVDDAIVVVENIVRHFHLPQNKGRPWSAIAVEAVNEVGNPTILATFAVISAVLPMAFVGGLDGALHAADSHRVERRDVLVAGHCVHRHALGGDSDSALGPEVFPPDRGRRRRGRERQAALPFRARGRFLYPALPALHGAADRQDPLAAGLPGGIIVLLLASMATVGLGWVKVKMLPFDNKSEFQIILNMPEGSALELTAQAAREIAAAVRVEPEVTDYQIYTGVAAPFNFNGLVRHYFMRRGPHIADLQINLVPKNERKAQSHDIAKRVRPRVAAHRRQIRRPRRRGRSPAGAAGPADPRGRSLWAERGKPPGAGPQGHRHLPPHRRRRGHRLVYRGRPDRRCGSSWTRKRPPSTASARRAIAQTLKMAVGGAAVDLLHLPREKEDVQIVVRLPQSLRTSPEDLLALRVRGANPAGALVPLARAGQGGARPRGQEHLPQEPDAGDLRHRRRGGRGGKPGLCHPQMNQALRALDTKQFGGSGAPLKIYNATQPFTEDEPAIKWDGEWHITIEVFRDLGSAFAAVLVLIFILMVGWFRSFLTPLVVMAAIPFSLVGILPAHGLLGAFFTATSMIGFMAGAGIVVRNSIILVDFIEQRLAEGMPLDQAVVDAGAVRFRPMLLTALAVVVGASVILADPIFQGLAISLMAGEIASLLISRMAVPVLYFMARK